MTPREQAILLLAQRKIRPLVRAQTGLTDADLDVLVDEIGDVAAMTRAANAIRRGDTSYVGPVAVLVAEQAGGQPQSAAEATVCPDDCDGCSCHLGNSAPCDHCVDDHCTLTSWCASTLHAPGCHADVDGRPCDDPAEHEPSAVVEPEEPDDCTRGPLCPAAVHDPHCDEAIEQAAAGGPIPTSYQGDTTMPIRQEQLEDDVPDAAAPPPAVVDTLRVLDLIGQLTPAGDRATLTMPLARLVDIDGTETVLVQAVIDVQLLPSAVLDVLDGRETEGPFTWTAERMLTAEGAEVVRTLAALLPKGGVE